MREAILFDTSEPRHAQIQRIKTKLAAAKKADKQLRVFGADSHQYVLNPPATEADVAAFEAHFSIQLPDCYKAFILHIGNSGIGGNGSAAGPYLGIFPLGSKVDNLIFDNVEQYLKNQCLIYPKMTDEYWESLFAKFPDDDSVTDEAIEKDRGRRFAGVLPIGSQGCTYLHGIVLNGPHKGKVVNLDEDGQKPNFTFENNFLDWYERWLDEIISGDLLQPGPNWFGYYKGGPEAMLLNEYINADNSVDKKDCLLGLLNKPKVKEPTLKRLENLLSQYPEDKPTLIQIICQSDYSRAKPHLLDLVNTDLRSVFQTVHWYAKDKCLEWLPVIQNNIHKIEDTETLSFCISILNKTKTNYGKLLLPFINNPNDVIRRLAFVGLGDSAEKSNYLDAFILGLNDTSNQVVHATLQALKGVQDKRLLEHYKNLAMRFPTNTDYILTNLNLRLAAYNLNNETILQRDLSAIQVKRWFEFWK